ncbi:unnamed protein product [Gadus morhua 'NCC']
MDDHCPGSVSVFLGLLHYTAPTTTIWYLVSLAALQRAPGQQLAHLASTGPHSPLPTSTTGRGQHTAKGNRLQGRQQQTCVLHHPASGTDVWPAKPAAPQALCVVEQMLLYLVSPAACRSVTLAMHRRQERLRNPASGVKRTRPDLVAFQPHSYYHGDTSVH